MCPTAQANRHDGPGLVGERVPGVAAVIEDVVIGAEDAVGEPVVAHELPDVLTGLSSGDFGGSGIRVMLSGILSLSERCQPAWSSSSTAWAPGVTVCEISARCSAIAAVLQRGTTRPAPV